jgi:hypothetical protein
MRMTEAWRNYCDMHRYSSVLLHIIQASGAPICTSTNSHRLHLFRGGCGCDGFGVKTKTENDFGFRLLNGIGSGLVGTDSGQSACGSTGNDEPPATRGSWTRFVAILRARSAAVGAWLAGFHERQRRTRSAAPFAAPRFISLRADEVVSFTRHQRVSRIEVQHGIVWLTGTPAEGDVLLHAGDRFDLGDASPYVVQALGEATLISKAVVPA